MPHSILAKTSKLRILQKAMGTRFLLINNWLWDSLPSSITRSRAMCAYGGFLHSLVQLRSLRTQYHGTFFFRNRAELALIRTISDRWGEGSTLRIAVLACSNGAEVYSILWTIRSARPDLNVIVHAVDISAEIVTIAENGVYSTITDKLVNSPIFERVTEDEMQAMFDRENDQLRIKGWIKRGINWRVADAGDPQIPTLLGQQDIVVANKFLCHLAPADAERCLRNIALLVKPGGYLFVSGIDLDIRTKVALDLGWTSVRELLEEIHNGDPSVRRDWPWKYWGLEPFSSKRPDWSVRYASVFQLGHTGWVTGEPLRQEKEAVDYRIDCHE